MTTRPKLRRKRSRPRGFSLVEVVIATGIFALLSVVLFSTLWSGRAQVSRLERAGNDDQRLLATRRFLISWLEAATPAGSPTEDVFRGEPQMMVFNASPADRQAANALYRIELRIERLSDEPNSASRLIVRRQRLSLQASSPLDGAPIETTQLLETARNLSFAYAAEMGSGPDGHSQRWSQTWPQPDIMPTRVQLRDQAGPMVTATVTVSKDPRCILKRGLDMLAGGECMVR